jgi:lipopolysaccharide transport system ATP-binding protein
MSDIAIYASGLGKRYRIGALLHHTSLRERLTQAMQAPARWLRTNGNGSSQGPREFWALRDVSFEMRRGEVVGLIGRNGAGKSTLLKILSRVAQPTVGHAEIYGRVGSLLEVGTGFHPELTGRENTYLNAAILGMGKREIARKFDEIVAFAEVADFIDTPIKHYSSGMQMRLAFAVAAHLDPEVLLVDEVLAVGDIRFQKKCLGKMGEVARTGRTIVLVSHNMAAINALSSRVILMKDGGIEFDGRPTEATARYYAESLGQAQSGSSLAGRAREGNGKACFTSLSLQPLGETGEPIDVAYPGCDLCIEVEIECRTQITESNAAVIIYDQNGFRVIDVNTAQKGDYVRMSAGQRARVSFLVHDLLLKPGQYFVGLWLGRHAVDTMDHVEHAVTLDVMEGKNNSAQTIVYPGVYLCRFEENVSIVEPLAEQCPP